MTDMKEMMAEEPLYEGGDEMAPEMMEEKKEEEKKPVEVCCTALAVLASDDEVQLFDKITSSASFTENETAQKFNVKTTTYEEFMDDKKVDTFDFVVLVFLKAASSDDLELKQDYYEYYSKVPLVHYAIAKKEQEDDELAGVKKYLKEKCDKRLYSGDPLVFSDLTNTEDCSSSLATSLD